MYRYFLLFLLFLSSPVFANDWQYVTNSGYVYGCSGTSLCSQSNGGVSPYHFSGTGSDAAFYWFATIYCVNANAPILVSQSATQFTYSDDCGVYHQYGVTITLLTIGGSPPPVPPVVSPQGNLGSFAWHSTLNTPISTTAQNSYTCALQSGALPGGINFTGCNLLSGTFDTVGNFSFVIRFQDSVTHLYTDVPYSLVVTSLTPHDIGYMGFFCSQHSADYAGVFCELWYIF